MVCSLCQSADRGCSRRPAPCEGGWHAPEPDAGLSLAAEQGQEEDRSNVNLCPPHAELHTFSVSHQHIHPTRQDLRRPRIAMPITIEILAAELLLVRIPRDKLHTLMFQIVDAWWYRAKDKGSFFSLSVHPSPSEDCCWDQAELDSAEGDGPVETLARHDANLQLVFHRCENGLEVSIFAEASTVRQSFAAFLPNSERSTATPSTSRSPTSSRSLSPDPNPSTFTITPAQYDPVSTEDEVVQSPVDFRHPFDAERQDSQPPSVGRVNRKGKGREADLGTDDEVKIGSEIWKVLELTFTGNEDSWGKSTLAIIRPEPPPDASPSQPRTRPRACTPSRPLWPSRASPSSS